MKRMTQMTRTRWMPQVMFGAACALAWLAPSVARAEDSVRLFSAKDDDAEQAVVVKKIKAELKLADAGKARPLVLAAVTTDAWGCECAPFVYKPFESSAEDETTAFFYPVVKTGPSPGSFVVSGGAGSYELTGKFTKDKLTFDGWLTQRKVKHRADKHAQGSLKAKQPVFAVDSWCFRKAEEISEPYAEIVAQMKKAGVAFCK